MITIAAARDGAEIVRRLRTVQPQSTARWGRMSAHQMVCHLADALRMATSEKAVSAATGPMQRWIVKWIVLYVPLSWPAGIPTRPELDQECGGTKPTDFASDVAAVERLLERVAAQPVLSSTHPIFGRMSRIAWLRWAYLHMDHHLRQFGA